MRALVVPVKALERSKRRLAPLLTPAERAALTLVMMEDVLEACLEQSGWEVWLISASEAVLEIGARRGARPVPECMPTLLGAIRQVENDLKRRRDELAVLLADLPLVTDRALADAL